LQITYSRAYVNLARVVSQYEKLWWTLVAFLPQQNRTRNETNKPLSTKVDRINAEVCGHGINRRQPR